MPSMVFIAGRAKNSNVVWLSQHPKLLFNKKRVLIDANKTPSTFSMFISTLASMSRRLKDFFLEKIIFVIIGNFGSVIAILEA